MGPPCLKNRNSKLASVPDYRRTFCKTQRGGCGKHAAEVGPISWRGLCRQCGMIRANRMYDDLTAHSGPGFELWREGMAASVGAVLVKARPD